MKRISFLILFGLLSYLSVVAKELDSIIVSSTSFFANDSLFMISTCDGDDESPALQWTGFPESTKSFAIIAEDPDAPKAPWVHWVVYDIPRAITFLEANQGFYEIMYHGAKHGLNDFGTKKYGGPCPPKGDGPHRYYFKIFALDTMLNLKPGLRKEELIEAMKNNIVARGTIMGYYERK
jgi:Raf kinase inhibitor-like YbhB/YbcL family protein